MNRTVTRLVLAALAAPGIALASPVASSAYTLSDIGGSWAWGRTAYNAVSTLGYVNDTADLATVQALLSDGYTPLDSSAGGSNGIYRWGNNGGNAAVALTFAFNGGLDHLLNSFDFISSRSLATNTKVMFDYSLDGGDWQTAVSTTSGGLGMVYNGSAQTYALSFPEVRADAFRLRLVNGDQVSLHEVWVEGSLANAVPEPSSAALVGVGLLGIGVAARRQRRISAP